MQSFFVFSFSLGNKKINGRHIGCLPLTGMIRSFGAVGLHAPTVGCYFSGISDSVFLSSCQKGSTVLMSARSVVV